MVVGWLVGGWSCRGVVIVKAGLVVKRRAWFYFVIVIDGIVRETLIFFFSLFSFNIVLINHISDDLN